MVNKEGEMNSYFNNIDVEFLIIAQEKIMSFLHLLFEKSWVPILIAIIMILIAIIMIIYARFSTFRLILKVLNLKTIIQKVFIRILRDLIIT